MTKQNPKTRKRKIFNLDSKTNDQLQNKLDQDDITFTHWVKTQIKEYIKE